MAVIDGIIPAQAFETVRNRIAVILGDELEGQLVLAGDYDNDAEVYVERFVAFDKTELPCINVALDRGSYDGQVQGQSDGTYLFNVDVYHHAKTTGTDNDERGDTLAMLKLSRLMGICRAILENPKYKTLAFTPPFVINRHVVSIAIANVDNKDAVNAVMGRLVVSVKVPETTEVITPGEIEGMDTTVKLVLTDKGYRYEGTYSY